MSIICTGSIAYDYLMSFPGYFKDHIIPDKLDSIMVIARNNLGNASTCDDEIKRLGERKKSFENKDKALRKYILSCLMAAGLDKLKTAKNTFTARKGSVSVVIDNTDLLPDELVTTQVVIAPDKKAIKEATGATPRCYPLEYSDERGRCFYTGKEGARKAIFAKAY